MHFKTTKPSIKYLWRNSPFRQFSSTPSLYSHHPKSTSRRLYSDMASQINKKRRNVDASSSRAMEKPSPLMVRTTPTTYGFQLHDHEHLSVFNRLKNKEMKGTRHIDFPLLATLGVQEESEWMANRVGWGLFFRINEPTYKGFTLDLLSTINAQILDRLDTEQELCTFQLGGNEWMLMLNQIDFIFGFPMVNDKIVVRHECRALWFANSFWHEIAGGPPYHPSTTKASFLSNPIFRIFHQFMVHTIFGRGDGKINFTRKDLVVFHAILKHKHLINSVGFLTGYLYLVGNHGRGAILIGGLVTKIV